LNTSVGFRDLKHMSWLNYKGKKLESKKKKNKKKTFKVLI
jgi:hypothetical protein